MKTKALIVLAALTIATPAFALDLQSARSSGAVVEQPSGYIKAAKSSPEVDSLVADVNAKRKAQYEQIAKKNGGTVEAVAAAAAQEIAKKH